MQKVQRWSQPFCTCTTARARPSKLAWPSMRCGAVSRTAMMSLTTIFSSAAMPKPSGRPKAERVSIQAPARNLSSLPMTRSTSPICAKVSGSVCAAQPVTTMRAPGRSRRSFRIAWRAWRTASAVTAQVLTTTVSARPAASATRRITSDS